MDLITLKKDEHAEIFFRPINRKLVMKLRGIISSQNLRGLRSFVMELFQSIGATQFEIDLVNSEYQEFDFEDEDRKKFYKKAAGEGINTFILKYPHKDFRNQILTQWKVYFRRNSIDIDVKMA